MKYKVGDRVKVRQDLKVDKKYGKVTFISNMVEFTSVTIKEVYEHAYGVEENDWRYTDEMLDEKDYSKVTHIEYIERKRKMLRDLGSESGTCDGTDCKKCPFFAVKNSKNISCYDFEREYPLEAIKIVMEYKNSILDGIEKEYLLAVIKPFKNKVIYIKKNKYDDNKEYIGIYTNNCELIELPRFAPNKMYKNMQVDKNYTLKELGLE